MANKEKKFDPSIGWFSIVVGLCLIAIRFLGNTDQWSKVDIVKLLAGVAIITYGVIRIIKDKKKSR